MEKENKSKSITVRLTPSELRYFKIACYQSGTTPSKFLRMMMQAAINAVQMEVQKGAINLEDYEAIFDDKLE